MILRRLDPARSLNRIGSRLPKAHRVRFGSAAAPQNSTTLMAASGGKAAIKSARNRDFEEPESAKSGHSQVIWKPPICATYPRKFEDNAFRRHPN
jgi:hypothetical protein